MRRLALLFVLAFGGALPAWACDCVAMGLAFQAGEFDAPDRFLALLASHDVVFAGRVVERIPFEAGAMAMGAASTVIAVDRQWAGASAEQMTIASDGSNCSYAESLGLGTRAIVFARREPSGQLVTEMCRTAPPVLLGYVTDDASEGYPDPRWTTHLGGLSDDAFARLDIAEDRLRAWAASDSEPTADSTSVTVIVTDALTGAPVPADSTFEIDVSAGLWGQVGGHLPVWGAVMAGPALTAFRTTVPTGVHVITASWGAMRCEVAIIATGGERVVHIGLLRPVAD